MSTIPGFIVCVLVPLLLLVGYDVVRRRIADKASDEDKEALLAELEALRAEKQAKEQNTDQNGRCFVLKRISLRSLPQQ